MEVSIDKRIQEECPDVAFYVFRSRTGKISLSARITSKENYSDGEVHSPVLPVLMSFSKIQDTEINKCTERTARNGIDCRVGKNR